MKGQKRAGETMPQSQTRCGVPYPLSPIPLYFPFLPISYPFRRLLRRLTRGTRVCPVVIRRTKRKYPGKNLKQAVDRMSKDRAYRVSGTLTCIQIPVCYESCPVEWPYPCFELPKTRLSPVKGGRSQLKTTRKRERTRWLVSDRLTYQLLE